MKDEVNKIRRALFEHRITDFVDLLLNVFNFIKEKSVFLDDEELKYVSDFIETINTLLPLGDYLLITDILEYEILPIVEKKEH